MALGGAILVGELRVEGLSSLLGGALVSVFLMATPVSRFPWQFRAWAPVRNRKQSDRSKKKVLCSSTIVLGTLKHRNAVAPRSVQMHRTTRLDRSYRGTSIGTVGHCRTRASVVNSVEPRSRTR
jgi:hypothetical protein